MGWGKENDVDIILHKFSNADPFELMKYCGPEYFEDYHNHIFFHLSLNPNTSIKFIREYIDKPWDWYKLTYRNDGIMWEIIKNNPDLPWTLKFIEGLESNLSDINKYYESWKVIKIFWLYDRIRNETPENTYEKVDILPKWFLYKENGSRRYPNMPLRINSFLNSPNLTWDMIYLGLNPANGQNPIEFYFCDLSNLRYLAALKNY